jgi:hypothetical protein
MQWSILAEKIRLGSFLLIAPKSKLQLCDLYGRIPFGELHRLSDE